MKRILLLVGTNLAIGGAGHRQHPHRHARVLNGIEAGQLPQKVATAGINGRPGWMVLFSSHPPIAQRIEMLDRSQRPS